MILPSPKKMASMIVMKKYPPKGGASEFEISMKPEIVKDEDEMSEGKHTSAEDLIAAMHERSPMKVAKALENFMHIYNGLVSDESTDAE